MINLITIGLVLFWLIPVLWCVRLQYDNHILKLQVENMLDFKMRDIALQQSPKAKEMLNRLVAELDKACKK